MSNKIGMFAVKPPPVDFASTIQKIMAKVAPQDAFITRFGSKEYGEWACFVIEDENYGYATEWCQALTAEMDCIGVSVFLLEWSWDFNVFHKGNHIAGREGYPHREPFLKGDLKAASELLQVSKEVFTKYCVSPTADCTDEQCDDDNFMEELDEKFYGFRAFEGDEVEPWDEWGFVDFIR